MRQGVQAEVAFVATQPPGRHADWPDVSAPSGHRARPVPVPVTVAVSHTATASAT